jgi:parallel beta-helix repeat protein
VWSLAVLVAGFGSGAASEARAPGGGAAGERFPCTVRLEPGADLQGAIDALSPRGPASVCLGPGVFRLHRFLSIRRDRLVLRGSGESTVLRLEEGTESPVVVIGDPEHEVPQQRIFGVSLEALRIVGGGPGGREMHPEIPYLTNSAIVIRAGSRISIRNVRVEACRSACILTERDTRDIRIERNVVEGAVWDGISLNRTARARIVGNRIRGHGAAGITTEHLVDSQVAANEIADNKTHGIYLSDSYRNRIVRNRFADNVLSGVFVTCAVRTRGPVSCWDRSMSAGNVFEANEFLRNRVAYMVGADDAANCADRRYERNLSLRDRFVDNGIEEPTRRRFGRCVQYVAPGGGSRLPPGTVGSRAMDRPGAL